MNGKLHISCTQTIDRQQMIDAFNRRYGEIPVEGSVEERREAQKERLII